MYFHRELSFLGANDITAFCVNWLDYLIWKNYSFTICRRSSIIANGTSFNQNLKIKFNTSKIILTPLEHFSVISLGPPSPPSGAAMLPVPWPFRTGDLGAAWLGDY